MLVKKLWKNISRAGESSMCVKRFAILYKVEKGIIMVLIFISHIMSDEEDLFIHLKLFIFYAPLKNSCITPC